MNPPSVHKSMLYLLDKGVNRTADAHLTQISDAVYRRIYAGLHQVQKLLHGTSHIFILFPEKIDVSSDFTVIHFIIQYIGMGLHTGYQRIADKGYSHPGAGNIIGSHQLIQF